MWDSKSHSVIKKKNRNFIRFITLLIFFYFLFFHPNTFMHFAKHSTENCFKNCSSKCLQTFYKWCPTNSKRSCPVQGLSTFWSYTGKWKCCHIFLKVFIWDYDQKTFNHSENSQLKSVMLHYLQKIKKICRQSTVLKSAYFWWEKSLGSLCNCCT